MIDRSGIKLLRRRTLSYVRAEARAKCCVIQENIDTVYRAIHAFWEKIEPGS